ncbi:hypothetical protein GCM10027088_68720 [Nocardia goodfellowii]
MELGETCEAAATCSTVTERNPCSSKRSSAARWISRMACSFLRSHTEVPRAGVEAFGAERDIRRAYNQR